MLDDQPKSEYDSDIFGGSIFSTPIYTSSVELRYLICSEPAVLPELEAGNMDKFK